MDTSRKPLNNKLPLLALPMVAALARLLLASAPHSRPRRSLASAANTAAALRSHWISHLNHSRASLLPALLLACCAAQAQAQEPAAAGVAPEQQQPPDARRRLISGEMPDFYREGNFRAEAVIVYTINADGSTRNIEVKQTSHQQFAKAAVAAVSTWRFDPSTVAAGPDGLSVEHRFKYVPEDRYGRRLRLNRHPIASGPMER